MNKTLKIATRLSPLALCQTEYVKLKLQKLYPLLNIELVKIRTIGDKILESPLAKIGGKGLFIKELEFALLQKKADIAIHSVKDMPYQIPNEFQIAAILKRENPFDALVTNNFTNIASLPYGARIGTCSLRRIVQLKALRPDFKMLNLRGNVGTRLDKLDSGKYDGVILACAGLIRLGLSSRISVQLTQSECLPAVGQGAIAVEVSKNNPDVLSLIKPLNDYKSAQTIIAERAMNAKLEGGCSAPIAAFATTDNTKITLNGLVASIKTNHILKQQVCGDIKKPHKLGIELADKLLSQGAHSLLAESRSLS